MEGKYIIVGKLICKIVPSTLGNSDFISLLSMNGKHLRHCDGIVTEQSYVNDHLFKLDSSFRLENNGDEVMLFCSNLGLENHHIVYNNALIIMPRGLYHNVVSTFKVLDNSTDDMLLTCLDKITHLENRLERFMSLFELHHPITQLPKTFGKLRRFQERGTEVLKLFDQICRKHNLSYWMDYGTLLGAVRHKGYIPWDDDLDVCMMYDDFCKFQQIIDKELQGTDIKYTHNFHPYIYKLERTTLGDEDAWLDIFPFYFQKENVVYEDYYHDFHKARGKRELLVNDPEKLRKFALEFNDKYRSTEKTTKIFRGFQAADHPLCDVRNYDDLFPLVELEFEGLSLFAPKNYLEKLQQQYGNFWAYPESLLSHRDW